MEIQYMSRANAISYCKEAHLAKTAIISISTPNREYTEAPFATTANGVQDILFLSFADIDGGDAPVRNIHGGEEVAYEAARLILVRIGGTQHVVGATTQEAVVPLGGH